MPSPFTRAFRVPPLLQSRLPIFQKPALSWALSFFLTQWLLLFHTEFFTQVYSNLSTVYASFTSSKSQCCQPVAAQQDGFLHYLCQVHRSPPRPLQRLAIVSVMLASFRTCPCSSITISSKPHSLAAPCAKCDPSATFDAFHAPRTPSVPSLLDNSVNEQHPARMGISLSPTNALVSAITVAA